MIQLNAPPDPSSFNPVAVLGAAVGLIIALAILGFIIPLILRFVAILTGLVALAAVVWWIRDYFRSR